ncbi:MAG: HlyD family secretion protein [Hyphomicrobiaceae bacterium]
MSTETEKSKSADEPAGTRAPQASRRHVLLRFVLLFVVPAVSIAGGVAFWLTGGRFVSTENAYVKTHIARVSAQVGGRIRVIHVRDHALVRTGDPLIELETAEFETRVAKAEAEVDAARQEIAARIAAWREANTELAEAKGRLDYLESQMGRQSTLASRGIVASTRLEDAEEELRRGRDRILVVTSKVHRMLTTIGGDPDLSIDEHPLVRQHLAELAEAKLDLERTTLTAPIDGQIVNLKLQPGEHVEAARPLLSLVSTDTPWLEANFKETELTHVRPGMTATLRLDIYPDAAWQGVVESISPATGAEFALLPPQNASGNWVKVVQRLPVKIRIVSGPGATHPMRAGMTATVSVDTERQRSIAQLLESFGLSGPLAAKAEAGAVSPSN